jgi:outer membrane murein-binding lipoprotein Lpp
MDGGRLHRSWNRNRLGLVAVFLSGLAIAGCASQKISDYDVLWSDGKCLFHAKGMSLEQAQNLQKKWDFESCNIEVDVSDKAKERKEK